MNYEIPIREMVETEVKNVIRDELKDMIKVIVRQEIEDFYSSIKSQNESS